MSTERPYGIRKATFRSTEPVRRFTSETAAINAARQISHDQGAATWIVSGPTGTHTIKYRRPLGRRPEP
jgi:hypothetical protein